MKFKVTLLFSFLFFYALSFSQTVESYKDKKQNYIQLSGELFKDVQLSGIFKDSKTFVDAVPLKDPALISSEYDSLKSLPDFDLAQFVSVNFKITSETESNLKLPEGQVMDEHIESLWDNLVREPDPGSEYTTLLPLKFNYIVPGGRFREIYYWDSFFTILGLLADDELETAENMVLNFSYLLESYNLIPNGNRVYYLTRSQPPFFALMVDIVCRYKNDYKWGLQFLDALETEYNFWMNGEDQLADKIPSDKGHIDLQNEQTQNAINRVVKLPFGGVLNRYYDFDTIPREESYKEDYLLGQKINDSLRPEFYRSIRAAAESGWDFSSRWFADTFSLASIRTTDILPVDLNCLLYFLEDRLSFFNELNRDSERSKIFRQKADTRKKLINEIFWNEEEKYYFDYSWLTGEHTKIYSLAGIFPLYFHAAYTSYAPLAAKKIEELFLKPGGLVTTPYQTGQQWDAPNGWAPLQWMTIKGLKEYGINPLANDIKKRWLTINRNVYQRTGRMVEKYNVINLDLFAGGGEYSLQDGFGWTNGVAAALISNFDEKYLFRDK
ncbi:MAG: trehalase family glycosidase [Ignavibacteriaceae bacterium]